MTPKVIILRVPPVGARLQSFIAEHGPLYKATCEDRSLPFEVQVLACRAWARENSVPEGWLDIEHGPPHYDLHGSTARRLGLIPPSEEIIKALSLWEPWAWLVALGHKPVENRGWATPYRGPLCIHAAKRRDPDEARIRIEVRRRFGIAIPEALPTGGIVGQARLTDCVTESESPWFTGPYGFVLAEAKPLPFVPCPGRQKLFDVNLALLKRASQGGA